MTPRDRYWPRCPGPVTLSDDDHVQIVVPDQPIQVDIKQVQSGHGAPVAEQAGLDVLELERGLEEGLFCR